MIDLENLKWMIKNSGLSYPQLQEKTGIHMNTIRRVATERGYNPTYRVMVTLLNFFKEQ